LNEAMSPILLSGLSRIWIQAIMELFSSSLVLFIGLYGAVSRGNPSLIGLALTYSIGFNRYLNVLFMSLANLEGQLNAVERLEHYCKELPSEPAAINDADPSIEDWPNEGIVDFDNISVYYPSTPDKLVLENVSFQALPKEKVAIVGRTGSGKSTLLNALLKLVDLKNGAIMIDGTNIQTIGTKALRSRIQIIPQDPLLFSGTIRYNLDIESSQSDKDIWDVLEMIGLKTYVASLEKGLFSVVQERGQNISLGQRQLVCLARVILMKPKILVMDEATASVDAEGDKLIQCAIQKHFKETTIISIVHRLDTIINYDKVLVLDRGRVVQFASPLELLQQKQGLFYEMARGSGFGKPNSIIQLESRGK
jgi:ATP-binding cassette, subfamily C (CFTR/MRP), member 1